MIDNPARKAANAVVRTAQNALDAAREAMAVMLADPAIPATAKNARLIPAKLPTDVFDPHAQVALLHAAGAACRWSCGCSRTTPRTGSPLT